MLFVKDNVESAPRMIKAKTWPEKLFPKLHQIFLCLFTVKSCRYNINGFVEELPQLPENITEQACTAFPATGVRPNPSFNHAGICGCWRIQIHWHLLFFCDDPTPWGRRLDSPCLPTKSNVRCSSINCEREAQTDWGFWWEFILIRGDDWNVLLLHAVQWTFSLAGKDWF